MEQTSRVETDSALTLSIPAVNPWEQDSRFISNVRNSLILAEQMGLKVLSPESESKCMQKLPQLMSSKLIAAQKEVTEKNKALHQVKLNIACMSQDKEVVQFLHHDTVEQRISMVNQLCTDLDSVLKNMNVLVHRLQKPFVGDHIKIDAAFHKFAKEVFTKIVPTMNDLAVHLDNVTWTANNDFSASHLEPLLVEVRSLAASMQTSYHMLSQIKKGVEGLGCHTHSSSDLDNTQEATQSLHISTSSSSPSGNSLLIQQRTSRANGGRVQ